MADYSEYTISFECSRELAKFAELYESTYEEPLQRLKLAYISVCYLTSVFAIVAGGILLAKLVRNRTGIICYCVVGLQLADGIVLFVWTILQYSPAQLQRGVHGQVALAAVGFFTQGLMNISDFVFATQYLVNSLQLGGTVSVAKTIFSLYAWLFAVYAIILACAIYQSLTAENFVGTKDS